MLVQNWMTKQVITVDENTPLPDAMQTMREHRIQILPVTRGGRLAGIVTDRDIKRAWPSDATTLDIHELGYLVARIKVSEIMKKKVHTVPPDYTVEEAAQMLGEHNISGVPVVDKSGEIVGIITKNDIFRVMVDLTGLGEKGFMIAMRLRDEDGAVQKVRDIVKEYSGKIFSKLTSTSSAPEGFTDVYFRCAGIDRGRWAQAREALMQVGELLYYVDHRTGQREIYHQP